MRLTAILTLYDRPISVVEQVFDSLQGQAWDQLVIVFDQTPIILADYCLEYWEKNRKVDFVDAPDREPGWYSPVKAWNAGFRASGCEGLYCLSSETVQAPGNLQRAKDILSEFPKPVVLHGKVECSCGPEGIEVTWTDGSPGNLFSDAAHPRPLGFIWAGPRKQVLDIGGYDENFSSGFWHDDTDFFFRLWRCPLDFIFDDSISGTHLHHERPTLSSPQGRQGIQKNSEYLLSKYGSMDPWSLGRFHEMAVGRKNGRTVWRHL